jgi:hypothetical protein
MRRSERTVALQKQFTISLIVQAREFAVFMGCTNIEFCKLEIFTGCKDPFISAK